MSSILVEPVIPVRCAEKNIIICRRVNVFERLNTLKEELEQDVKDSANEIYLKPKTVYALKQPGKPWLRAMVKFIRKDDVAVLQLLDVNGLLHFNPSTMMVRKINKRALRDLEHGEIKLCIYAIGIFEIDYEYELIFNQILKDKSVTALLTLLEKKANKMHECYVGDLIYVVNGKQLSFRELLIKDHLTYPSRSKGELNQRIFRKRTEWMAIRNVGASLISEVACKQDNAEPMEIIANRFHLFEVLGEGTFGIVVRGRDTLNGMQVAMKIFKSTLFGHKDKRKENLQEANIIRKMDHVNVINLIDFVNDESGVYLIFPLMKCTLDDIIYDPKFKCTPERFKKYATQILSGLQYMNNFVIHRDIKPTNVLVSQHDVIKISDFGIATIIERNQQYFMDICGTYRYTAPEVFLRFGYNVSVDIWSTGCTLAEVWMKKPMFPRGKTEIEQVRKIFEVCGTPTSDTWPVYNWTRKFPDSTKVLDLIEMFGHEFWSFLRGFLTLNPKERVTASIAIQHPFLQQMD